MNITEMNGCGRMYRRESYLSRIRPFMGRNIVKVLTGIRRCGKSALLELIQEELRSQGVAQNQFISVNLEGRNNPFAATVDGVYGYIKKFAGDAKGKIYLFIDEIQELDGWETMVHSCMLDFDADIYIAASNADLLAGEGAGNLGGRFVEFRIYPLSFREVMEIMPEKSKVEAFLHYLTRGGMPFLYQVPVDDKSALQYLSDMYDAMLLKDIVARNKIRDIELLKRIIRYFIANIGNSFSAADISKYLKKELRSISTETIYNYIEYCKTACLLHLVPREDVIGKKSLQFQEKIYLADHGIREAVYGNNLRDINQTLKNIVYLELLRRGYQVSVGKNGRSEIDFVAALGKGKIYVQVTYLLTAEEIMEREFSALETIPDNYPKYVVSMDGIDRGRNGIKNINIRDFLLMDQFS